MHDPDPTGEGAARIGDHDRITARVFPLGFGEGQALGDCARNRVRGEEPLKAQRRVGRRGRELERGAETLIGRLVCWLGSNGRLAEARLAAMNATASSIPYKPLG